MRASNLLYYQVNIYDITFFYQWVRDAFIKYLKLCYMFLNDIHSVLKYIVFITYI